MREPGSRMVAMPIASAPEVVAPATVSLPQIAFTWIGFRSRSR